MERFNQYQNSQSDYTFVFELFLWRERCNWWFWRCWPQQKCKRTYGAVLHWWAWHITSNFHRERLFWKVHAAQQAIFGCFRSHSWYLSGSWYLILAEEVILHESGIHRIQIFSIVATENEPLQQILYCLEAWKIWENWLISKPQ